MKIKYIIFLWFIISYTLHATDNQDECMNSGGLVINYYNNNESSGTLHNQQQADHFSSQNTDVRTRVSNKSDSGLSKKLHDLYEQQAKNAQGVIGWMQSNRLKSMGIGLLCTYSYIFYHIHQANIILNNPNSWCNWHHSNSLEDLFALPHAMLESDLLFAIQTRYVHPTNPTDFIYSIVQSSNSLHQEMSLLQNQITRYKWLKTCHCMPLFFINEQELATLEEKHRKLAFIKHLFASWCANYKIEKNS